MAGVSEQRYHDADHLLRLDQAAFLVARVEGVGAGALHVVVARRDDGRRNRREWPAVIGLRLGHTDVSRR
jgi:hypothetical protein